MNEITPELKKPKTPDDDFEKSKHILVKVV